MQYVVQDSEGKKMIMDVVSTIPQLPEGWAVLGLPEHLPEEMAEIQDAIDAEEAKVYARKFLADSDWKVTRHRDQVDAGIATSLSAEEFTQLLTQRQAARDLI